MLDNIITLLMLVMLQAVLGFDNLLYISLESKKAPIERQSYVRKMGIGLAIVFRIVLLFVLVKLIGYFQDPVLHIPFENVIEGHFNIHSIIVLIGGVFIVFTAMKEIWHMVSFQDFTVSSSESKSSVSKIITMIVVMNVVFSFDSILSAMALTDVLWIMTTAIVIGGLLMIWLSEKVTDFLTKNRMYESNDNKTFFRGVPRQVGIELATGDLITYMDSDDYMMPGATEIITAEFYKSDLKHLFNIAWYDHEKSIGYHVEMKGHHSYPERNLKLFNNTFIEAGIQEGNIHFAPWLHVHVPDIDVKWKDVYGTISEDVVFVKALIESLNYTSGFISIPYYVRCHLKDYFDV